MGSELVALSSDLRLSRDDTRELSLSLLLLSELDSLSRRRSRELLVEPVSEGVGEGDDGEDGVAGRGAAGAAAPPAPKGPPTSNAVSLHSRSASLSSSSRQIWNDSRPLRDNESILLCWTRSKMI
jgi:hypothetical protein